MVRFRVNEPNVVFEAFEEEVVLVNLDSGNYYSLRGSGPQIWMALAGGADAEEIAAAIGDRPGSLGTDVRDSIGMFAAQLVAEELLLEMPGGSPAADALDEIRRLASFEPPLIESYHDMQDLLALDPIHDVDPAGWPLAKQQ